MKKILALALTLALALPLAACGGDSGSASTSQEGGVTEVTVGVVGASNGQWDTVNELLADEGIHVTLVEFSDYKLPNEALKTETWI